MNERDYIREINALHAPNALREKIAALPHATPSRQRRAPSTRWLTVAAALVLVVGLGAATPAIIRFFSTGGDITTPPPIPVTTVAPAISDEELTELLIEEFPTPSEGDRHTLLFSASQAGRTLGVLHTQTGGGGGGYGSLLFGIFDNATKALIGDTRFHGGDYGEVYGWTDREMRVHIVWTNRSTSMGMDFDCAAGLYTFSAGELTEIRELPILAQVSSMPTGVATMFDPERRGDFWEEHKAQVNGAGLELYYLNPDFNYLTNSEVDQWLYDGYVRLDISTGLDPALTVFQGVGIDQIDYEALKTRMDAATWAAFEGYFPTLKEGGSFHWVREEGTADVTLEEFYQWAFGLDSPDGALDLERLTLFGFEGDGGQDLILGFFNGGGSYLILHREGQEIYGTDMGYRSFKQLQADGVFMGSSGAAYNSYYRMKFQDGVFEKKLLGEMVGEHYEIGGIAVSEEYFTRWREGLMVGDMWWYDLAPEAPELSINGKNLLIRYPGEADWTDVLPMLPLPDEWSTDSHAPAIDGVTSMAEVYSGSFQGFTSPTEGWVVLSGDAAMGQAYNYIYLTHDGGHTWVDATGNLNTQYPRVLNCAVFSDAKHGFLGFRHETGAPFYWTEDGGKTWKLYDMDFLPLPQNEDTVYELKDITFDGSEGTLSFIRYTHDDRGQRIDTEMTLALTNYGTGIQFDTMPIFKEPLDPYSIKSSQLPYGDPINAWSEMYSNLPLQPLARLPEAGIDLYGLNEYWCGTGGVLLVRDRDMSTPVWYDLPCYRAAGGCSLALADYDGDGQEELAMVLSMGSGTGLAEYALYMVELEGRGFRSYTAFDEDALRPLVRDALRGFGAEGYDQFGQWQIYSFDEGAIHMELAVRGSDDNPNMWRGFLSTDVCWDGEKFSLKNAQFTKYDE